MFVPGIGTAAGAAIKGGVAAAKVGTGLKAGQAVSAGTRAAGATNKAGSAIKYQSKIPQPQSVTSGSRQLALTGPKGSTTFAPTRPGAIPGARPGKLPGGPKPISPKVPQRTPGGPQPMYKPGRDPFGPMPGVRKPLAPKSPKASPKKSPTRPIVPKKPSTPKKPPKAKTKSKSVKDKIKKYGKIGLIAGGALLLGGDSAEDGPPEIIPDDPILLPPRIFNANTGSGTGTGTGSDPDPSDEEVVEESTSVFIGNTVDASNKAVVGAFIEKLGESLQNDYRNIIESATLNSVDNISPVSTIIDPESINILENTIGSQLTDEIYSATLTPILTPAEFAAIAIFGTTTGSGFTANAVRTDSSGLPIIDLKLTLPDGKNIAGYDIQYIQGEIT